ncbi:MAG: caspase family protein [Myxococcus sp.]|nr:caspase family protein [Myxococcus sp.]
MRLLVLLVLLSSLPAAAVEPVRLVVSLGSNYGRPDDAVLQHAEDDARRVRDVFVELGGVEASRALVLTRPTATQVRERFAEVAGRVAELKASGRPVQVVVFATSHGRNGVLHLTGSELGVSELRELAGRTGAELRVVIVDACESGVRSKGAKKGPAYALSLATPSVSGDVFVSSSGAREAAQEWDALSGSLFTHHLLSALRGDADADHDGKVSLMEAYAYAERRTVAESVDVGQHPQFDVGLAGSSDVTLTEPSKARARVSFDEGLEGRYVLVSQPRPDIVVEVNKAKGRALSVAVPPGRYVLRQTRGFSVAMQEVELPFGGVASIDGRRFVTRDFGEVALKGGELEFHPHAVRLTGALLSTPIDETPARWSVGLSYRLALGAWWAQAAAGWGTASYRGSALGITDHRVTARLSGGPRFWLGPVIVMVGAVGEVSLLRQDFTREREAEIRKSYPALPGRLTPGAALGPQASVEVPLWGPLFGTAAVSGLVRALPLEGGATWSLGGDVELGLGLRL